MSENRPSESKVSGDEPTLPGLSPSSPGLVVRYFGDYELLEEVARGGMGVVYKARQVSLSRLVALKMILAGQLASAQDVDRFHAEAEAAAHLDHPGIVPIYEVGIHEGQHFFSMAFVAGPSLAQRLTAGPLPPRDAAELLHEAAEAVAYAHARGVIHRDIKPGNILLGDDGQPRITDFGLAKRVAGDRELTLTGQILGTPSFMPPEQASGKGERVEYAADVYALGAVLYATLVGRPPFQAASPIDTVFQVLHRDAVAPRQLNAKIPRDLETICLKCLRKDPRRRYADGGALADDLRRYLDHLPIRARRIGPAERCIKWARRRPPLAALILVALAGFAGVTWQRRAADDERRAADEERRVANEERRVANEERLRAERLLDASRAEIYIKQINSADREWTAGHVGRAIELLDECDPAQRGWEWRYLRRRCHPEILTVNTASGYSAEYSPDGQILAVPAGDHVEVCYADTGVPFWYSARHNHPVRVARFSPDGVWLLSGGGSTNHSEPERTEGEIQIQRVKGDTARLVNVGHAARVVAVAFHPDGERAASCDVTGLIKLWRVADASELLSLKISAEWAGRSVCDLAFDPSGERLAAVSSGAQHVYSWKLDDPSQPIEYAGFGSSAAGQLALSPDGRKVAAADQSSTVIVWDAATGAVLHRFHEAGHFARFSPDGAQLATADDHWYVGPGRATAVRIWNLADGKLLRRFRGGWGSVAYSPDGKRIASKGYGFGINVWDVNQAPDARRVELHHRGAGQFAFTSDGETLVVPNMIAPIETEQSNAAGTVAGEVRPDRETIVFVRAGTGQEIRRVPNEVDQLATRDLAVGPAGKWFATVHGWGGQPTDPPCQLVIRDAETGQVKRTIQRPPQDHLMAVAVHPDGERLAIGKRDSRVEILRASNGAQEFSLPIGSRNLAFSPNGALLATASFGEIYGHLSLWDTTTGQRKRKLEVNQDPTNIRHSVTIGRIAFSPDGRYLAGCCDKSRLSFFITVWEVSTGVEKYVLLGHRDEIKGVAFSPDGERLVSGGLDESLIVWNMRSGARLLTLPSAVGKLVHLAFSPKGNRVAAMGLQGLQLGDSAD